MSSSNTTPWALFDMNNLIWKTFHATKGTLDRDGSGVGAIYAAMLSAVSTMRSLGSTRAIWCFDVGGAKTRREVILPAYKSTRKAIAKAEAIADPEMAQAKADLMRMIDKLRASMTDLRMCVLGEPGLEADDLLARAAADVDEKGEEGYIVSTDEDMYQCLSPRIRVVRTNAQIPVYGVQQLMDEFGVGPDRWHLVKAIAGCKGDDVPGVDGAGVKTAAKYIAGTLPTHHKIYTKIKDATEEWTARLPLVELPWEGTPLPDYARAKNTMKKLQALYEEWGFQWQP